MKTAIVILLFVSQAWAHTIAAVKGQKALLNLDESSVQIGDIYSVTERSGTEAAQIQITQIRDKNAIAIIQTGTISGQPSTYSLQFVKAGKRPVSTVEKGSTVKVPQAKGYYAGLSANQVSVNLTSSTTLKMTGTSFNLGALYERALTSRVQVLIRGGYESIKAKGALSSNACGADCNLDVGYLDADVVVKYSFYQKDKTWWLGGGVGFLFPVIKSSNVLDSEKMSLTERLLVGGGVNWYRNANIFIPVQLDYAIQPSNSVVAIQQIILRAGYGWNF